MCALVKRTTNLKGIAFFINGWTCNDVTESSFSSILVARLPFTYISLTAVLSTVVARLPGRQEVPCSNSHHDCILFKFSNG